MGEQGHGISNGSDRRFGCESSMHLGEGKDGEGEAELRRNMGGIIDSSSSGKVKKKAKSMYYGEKRWGYLR